MEPTKKKISEEERQKNLKVWSKNFQVGKKVFIRQEPKNAKKEGLHLGKVFEIVEPPKNHLNTAMAVWIMGKSGKKICISFPYIQYLPKGGKADISKLVKKETEDITPKVYKEELEHYDSSSVFEEVIKSRQQIIRKRTVEPVVVRRRRRT